jgi:hypothetical protein
VSGLTNKVASFRSASKPLLRPSPSLNEHLPPITAHATSAVYLACLASHSAGADLRHISRSDFLVVKQRILLLLALLILAGVLGCGFYSLLYQPYFVLPREDRAFLATRPNRQEVVRYFHRRPAEELRAGERFPPTGWYPLPEQPATHSALSFVRRYGSKIYVFFGLDGEMEHFVVSSS